MIIIYRRGREADARANPLRISETIEAFHCSPEGGFSDRRIYILRRHVQDLFQVVGVVIVPDLFIVSRQIKDPQTMCWLDGVSFVGWLVWLPWWMDTMPQHTS